MKHLKSRRRRLSKLVDGRPVLFCAGALVSRNYPANHYPFRASSHFLYFVGTGGPGAAALIEDGECTLFYDFPSPEEAVWVGNGPSRDELLEKYALKDIRPVAELPKRLDRSRLMALGAIDPVTQKTLKTWLRRNPDTRGRGPDRDLALAVIEMRLNHDSAARAELKRAAAVTVKAHLEAMKATRPNLKEADILAIMMKETIAAGMETSFSPIVSIHGEILHNPYRVNTLREGDLLLVDFGAETAQGWAGDVTRTFPVSGRFTPLQRDIYEIVLKAQLEAIALCRPGVRFRDVHLKAARVITEGLCALKILKGDVDSLVERGVHALFFPHGVGHLLGLDVHDMEDLGDLAGYSPGRTRSLQFGMSYLRLDRDLEPNMAVTIEPGFYWIPQVLEDPERLRGHRSCLDLERLEALHEVRGIRIEDDILVTESEPEILTSKLPKTVSELEETVGRRSRSRARAVAR